MPRENRRIPDQTSLKSRDLKESSHRHLVSLKMTFITVLIDQIDRKAFKNIVSKRSTTPDKIPIRKK